MSETHLDHPGDVSWFKGHGPADVIGDCDHDCPHDSTAVIAWGPDYEHYCLTQCDVWYGCAGQCRAWSAEYPPPFSDARPKYRQGPWKFVDVDSLVSATSP